MTHSIIAVFTKSNFDNNVQNTATVVKIWQCRLQSQSPSKTFPGQDKCFVIIYSIITVFHVKAILTIMCKTLLPLYRFGNVSASKSWLSNPMEETYVLQTFTFSNDILTIGKSCLRWRLELCLCPNVSNKGDIFLIWHIESKQSQSLSQTHSDMISRSLFEKVYSFLCL